MSASSCRHCANVAALSESFPAYCANSGMRADHRVNAASQSALELKSVARFHVSEAFTFARGGSDRPEDFFKGFTARGAERAFGFCFDFCFFGDRAVFDFLAIGEMC